MIEEKIDDPVGIERIRKERIEQIVKHGKIDDIKDNPYGQLKDAAMYILSADPSYWPLAWNESWKEKFDKKDQIEKLVVAGALIAAEIDRLTEEK